MKTTGKLSPPHGAASLPETEPRPTGDAGVQLQLGRIAECDPGSNDTTPRVRFWKRTGEMARDRLRID